MSKKFKIGGSGVELNLPCCTEEITASFTCLDNWNFWDQSSNLSQTLSLT